MREIDFTPDCPPARPEVLGLAPYVPGRAVAEVQREMGLRDVIKLASNENPLGAAPAALKAASQALLLAHAYPESRAPNLQAALAAHTGLPADWIALGNGSDELFRLLALSYLRPGSRAVVPDPGFPTYTLASRLAGAEVTRVPLRPDGAVDLHAMALAARRAPQATLVWLCSPHNPTGAAAPLARELPALFATLPKHVLVVLDQAYGEFEDPPFDPRPLLRERDNLVVTRTFSKAYGLAGLRVGYALAQPAVLRPLWLAREPFSVNAVAQAAAVAALQDRRHLERSVALARECRAFLQQVARDLGATAPASQANFALLDLGRPAAPVAQALLQRGIIVRPCDSFGLPNCLRVSAGQPREMDRFARAAREVLAGR